MQYTGLPRVSGRRSIQPFATILATVCLPARSLSLGVPTVGLIPCSVDLSIACGIWLGRGGIVCLH
jgi:hypothetical protein